MSVVSRSGGFSGAIGAGSIAGNPDMKHAQRGAQGFAAQTM